MIVYRITNKINGKTYVGMDFNNNPHYFGSGIVIKKAILQYGKENFTKEILESGFSSKDAMIKAEIKWIAREKLNNPRGTYNLSPGGTGGSEYKGKTFEEIYGLDKSNQIKRKMSQTNKLKGIRPPSRLGTKGSEKQRLAAGKTCKTRNRSAEEINKLIARSIRPIMCVQNGISYESIKEASEHLNLNRGNMSSVLRGNRKHTKGFTFIYLERK